MEEKKSEGEELLDTLDEGMAQAAKLLFDENLDKALEELRKEWKENRACAWGFE